MLRIVVVDDDAIVALSMKTIIMANPEMEVVATGNDGSDAIALYEQYKPDVLLSDIQMKNVSGLAAAEQILAKYPDARIVFLTTFTDDEYIKDALRIGAKGYILKQDFEGIVPSINAVMSGQSVFGNNIVDMIPKVLVNKDTSVYDEKGISDKELEIIYQVAEGLSNKEIADKLCLGEGTVRNYISNILEKLELRDRTQLAVFYYKH